MNQISPLVSIICCLYNTPSNLFKKSLESAINQTYNNFEFIIMNDGSNKYLEENTKLIEDLKDNRFKLYHKDHDGKSNTLNEAIKLANGKYIAIWDSDDSFYKNRLEYQVNLLENTNIECLSNKMIDSFGIIHPVYDHNSEYITKDTIHYLAFHPCQMFNKEIVLHKVPYLFENCYDSMEDSIFNHIMFYNNVVMYYDNTILGDYSQENENCAHKDNLYGYLKFCTENLRYKCINNLYNKLEVNNHISIVLLVNELWENEIEKTIFNIRITSEKYVDIIISSYNKYELKNPTYLQEWYNVNILYNDTYINALNNGLKECKNDIVFVISNPIRICNEMWDWRLYRFINNEFIDINSTIIQPIMFDMEKKNNSYYKNSRGKYEKHNIQYGERLTLLTNELSEKIIDEPIKSEYCSYYDIPLLNDSLCFITSKQNLLNLINNQIFFGPDLFNVLISLISYSNNQTIKLFFDIQLSIDNIIYNGLSSYTYYMNYIFIVNTFLHETKYIYDHILKNLGLTEQSLNKYKTVYDIITKDNKKEYNLESFFKNINQKQPWLV